MPVCGTLPAVSFSCQRQGSQPQGHYGTLPSVSAGSGAPSWWFAPGNSAVAHSGQMQAPQRQSYRAATDSVPASGQSHTAQSLDVYFQCGYAKPPGGQWYTGGSRPQTYGPLIGNPFGNLSGSTVRFPNPAAVQGQGLQGNVVVRTPSWPCFRTGAGSRKAPLMEHTDQSFRGKHFIFICNRAVRHS